MDIKAVIFDMDGTLHDTEYMYYDAWHEAGILFGLDDIDEATDACTGMGTAPTKIYWEKRYPYITWEEFYRERERVFFRLVEERGIAKKKGAEELFIYLKENGYKIAIATSSSEKKATPHLRMSGLGKYTDAVVTGTMVENGKPYPDIFLKAAEMLDVEPKCCMGVEDSQNGILAISAAGMYGVLIPDRLSPSQLTLDTADAVCDDLFGIIKILENDRKV